MTAQIIPLPRPAAPDLEDGDYCELGLRYDEDVTTDDSRHREDIHPTACGCTTACLPCREDIERACRECALEAARTEDVNDTDDCEFREEGA